MVDERILPSPMVRTRVHLRGQVQGVGFRPFVYLLATDMALGGWVRNDGGGVELEIQGTHAEVERFLQRLRNEAPSAARIEHLAKSHAAVCCGEEPFSIVQSADGVASTSISPDSAVCAACASEMFDPANRRYRYPFTHCVQCGPRYTITACLPYDRVNTSMAAFSECTDCRTEREQSNQRRFHAQTNACTACGPRLWLSDAAGQQIAEPDVITAALARLACGEILAIKGLGGFHLVCDARNANAVRLLRERKARAEKPFAVMCANAVSANQFVQANQTELTLLASPQRPIVLLPKRKDCDALLPGVAPELACLGVMLPYTPIQYLLFHEAAGRPAGMDWLEEAQPMTLVMTSANPHGEPLVTGNRQALSGLGDIADAFLMHDREIVIRCDDSVVRPTVPERAPQFVRRARGYVPTPIALDLDGAPGLAAGAYLNNTVCVARSGEAFVSEHIGDLDTRASCVAFSATVTHLLDILQVEPAWVAADLHPDFHSTQFARALAAERHLPLIEVQHHHAHIGAVMAEHRLPGCALGVALDGFGLGSDGAAWGGELLVVDGAQCERLGHLHPLPLPGGDRAAREPWRMAAAALFELGRRDDIVRRFGPSSAMIGTMLEKGLNSPRTSSAGRLFDTTAGLLGIKPVTGYEGQAAAMLEGLAASFGEVEPMASGYTIEGMTLNMLPLLGQLANMHEVAYAAALFHATVAAALAEWVLRAAQTQQIHDIVFGGGCFINRLLSQSLRTRLEAQNLHVFEATMVPPGDGGLSLGQAWVALRQLHS
jgi:hydrogenase maturation protein HypF